MCFAGAACAGDQSRHPRRPATPATSVSTLAAPHAIPAATAAANGSPRSSASARPPTKASPAPIGLRTAATDNPGSHHASAPSATAAPAAAAVTTAAPRAALHERPRRRQRALAHDGGIAGLDGLVGAAVQEPFRLGQVRGHHVGARGQRRRQLIAPDVDDRLRTDPPRERHSRA